MTEHEESANSEAWDSDEELQSEASSAPDHDLREYGIYPQLAADGADADAAAYLRSVRDEAAQLPDVVTSSVDPAMFQARQTAYVPAELALPACAAYRPDTGWLAEFLADFAALRRRLQGSPAVSSAAQQELPSPTSPADSARMQ
ncbi:hypothetical protein WJX81_001797 [Elliptochloris bilobata]|uniref:Uncharacterized protein n=1 Tax=Elliptochloris bilobata TaxID=381761 RepID=A0AAW1RJW7_9CHLO